MGRPYQSYHSHIAPTFAGESPMFVCSLLEHIVSFELKQPNINSYKNPPTPAFAKAGAAPGTTAGVELFRAGFKCARQLPPSLAVSLCCSRVAAWPFACTSLAAASTKLLAVSVPALQPALCLHIALSC